MKTKLFLLLITFLFINFVVAQSFCVDVDTPSSPELSAMITGTNIQLTWAEATDIPDCSGIDYYEIWKNNIYLTQTSELTYTDTDVTYGTYSYVIYAVDKASHTNSSDKATITLTETTSTVIYDDSGGGGGGGSSYDDDEDTPAFTLTGTDTQENGEETGEPVATTD